MKYTIILLLMIPIMLFAGNENLIKEAKKSQAKAKKALEILDVTKAKKNALHAISIIEKNNLTQRDLAEIYIIAGVLDLTIEDGKKAKNYFKKALKLDSTIRIPSNFSSDDVEKVFLDAKDELAEENYKIMYEYSKNHDSSEDFEITVMVLPIPSDGTDIYYFYSLDQVHYKSIVLRKENKKFVGKISSSKFRGKTLDVYISLMNENLDLIASYGTEENPLHIKLKESDDKFYEFDKKDKINEKHLNSFIYSPKVSINLKSGLGVGYVTEGETIFSSKNLEVSPGILFSPLWIGLDTYYTLSNKLSLGLDGYVQTYSATLSPAWGISLMGRYTLLKANNYRFFLGGGLGYGETVFKVDVSSKDPKQVIDIVKSSFAHLNVDASFVFMFSNYFGASFTFKTDFIVPSISFVEYFSAGIYLEF